MAATSTSEASEIRRRGRQRLIGAVALVMLLVVFVPMILDSEPRPAREAPALAIPPKANAPALPTPVAKAAPEAKAVPAAKTAPVAKAAPEAKPDPAPAAAPKLEGFAVQVGAFRDEAKLGLARQKLTAAGIAHYTELLDAQGGPLTRLRAGPFTTREAAESALAKLKRSALDGKVVPLP